MKCVYLWNNVFFEDLLLWKDSIVRISNELARELVREGSANYMPKKAYKRELLRAGGAEYIYNPKISGRWESSRTVKLYEDTEGFILGDYNAAGDLCGVEIIGDVDQAEINKITNW